MSNLKFEELANECVVRNPYVGDFNHCQYKQLVCDISLLIEHAKLADVSGVNVINEQGADQILSYYNARYKDASKYSLNVLRNAKLSFEEAVEFVKYLECEYLTKLYL